MLFLPKSVAALCDLAGKGESRWSMTGINLKVEPHGGFRAEATDGRRAGVCQEGPYTPTAAEEKNLLGSYYVTKQLLDATPDEKAEGLIPATALKDAFRALKKENRVGVLLLPDECVLCSGNVVSRTPYVDGRFPDINGVIPEKPIISVNVNPVYLMELCKLASDILKKETDSPNVTVCFYKNASGPFGITLKSEAGIFADLLLMPLSSS